MIIIMEALFKKSAGVITAALIACGFVFYTTASAQVEPITPALPPSPDIQESLCAGVNLDVRADCDSGITNAQAEDKVNDLISDIINIFSLIVGVVSVIMIIIGGFRYITSGGDSTNVSSAKNTILYAIVGLIIVALAQTIVRFILGRVIEA